MEDQINLESATAATEASEPAYMLATASDFDSIDVSSLFAGTAFATYHQINKHILEELQRQKELGKSDKTSEVRALSSVSAVASMYLRDENPNDPFGPMLVFNTGRSAAISDFSGKVEVLLLLADRCDHPLMAARCADMAWLINRRLGNYASKAVQEYVNSVRQILAGELKVDYDTGMRVATPDIKHYVARALAIGAGLRKQRPDLTAINELCNELFNQSISQLDNFGTLTFGTLAAQYEILDFGLIAEKVENVLNSSNSSLHVHMRVQLWRLASQCYHRKGIPSDKARCQAEAAEELARHAMLQTHSALVCGQFLTDAISHLQGVPGKRDRRNELRSQLVEVQSRAYDEMGTYSHEIDLTEEIKQTVAHFSEADLVDQLLDFAIIDRSPDPSSLEESARRTIQEFPLSSIFSTVIMDRDGKVIEKADANGGLDGPSTGSLLHKISQEEAIRRQLTVGGRLEPARQTIAVTHIIDAQVLEPFLFHSPFVPPNLRATYAHGLARYFQADFVSAVYILVPLVEGSLRYLLKSNGIDVSTIDAASGTQENRTISTMFTDLRSELNAILTPAIVDDIDRVFLSKFGPHIRHSVAHGSFSDGDVYSPDAMYACCLIFRLCIIPLTPFRNLLKTAIQARRGS